ncbi:MAG: hypothetical protein ACOY4D_01550 [Pseudomonadota bacterium]
MQILHYRELRRVRLTHRTDGARGAPYTGWARFETGMAADLHWL